MIIQIFHSSWSNPVVHRVDSFPCRIGRSVNNDIVMTDDSISAEHALIEKQGDGSFSIRDLDSTNGILFEGKKYGQLILRDNGVIKIGDLEVTTLFSDERLEKTRLIEVPKEFKTIRQKRLKRIFLSILGLFVLQLLSEYLNDPMETKKILSVLWGGIFSTSIVFGLSGLVAIISKVQHKKYDFAKYLEVTLFLALGFWVFIILSEPIGFTMNNRLADMIFSLAAFSAGYFLYFSNVLKIFFQGRHEKKIWIFLSIFFFSGVGLFALTSIYSDSNTKFSYRGSYIHTTRTFSPKDYSFTDVKSQLEKSFDQVDEYRQEKVDEKKENREIEMSYYDSE